MVYHASGEIHRTVSIKQQEGDIVYEYLVFQSLCGADQSVSARQDLTILPTICSRRDTRWTIFAASSVHLSDKNLITDGRQMRAKTGWMVSAMYF